MTYRKNARKFDHQTVCIEIMKALRQTEQLNQALAFEKIARLRNIGRMLRAATKMVDDELRLSVAAIGRRRIGGADARLRLAGKDPMKAFALDGSEKS